jgi:phosphoglycerate dehydrogenase-like enzyme
MTDHSYHVYVIQGRGQRDYSDCQAALAHVPARMTALPFLGTEDEVIAKTRDADALVTSASPVTRSVMSALEGLKGVARTGVGYDVIDVPAARSSSSTGRCTPGCGARVCPPSRAG